MSFDKDSLKKIASEIKANGVTSRLGKQLRKEARDMRIAYLSAFIKKQYS